MSEDKKRITAINITGKKINIGDIVELSWFYDTNEKIVYRITKIIPLKPKKLKGVIVDMEAKIHDGEDKERT